MKVPRIYGALFLTLKAFFYKIKMICKRKCKMLQDIYPSRFNNVYCPSQPDGDDAVFVFDEEGRLYARTGDEGMCHLTYKMLAPVSTVYLFAIDEKRYYLALDRTDVSAEGYGSYPIRKLRDIGAGTELFAAFTAYHLWKWYSDNRFCGSCAAKMVPAESERALICEKCGKIIYPRINPAVIVGVINGDKLLITRYNRGYAHNALIAGFCEIGETLEETVQREVMEEAGISVKNIRYYKSQPWGMAQDLLAGFFCEADGDTTIHMDDNELKYAAFVKRDELELQPNDISLTNEMMRVFKEGRI